MRNVDLNLLTALDVLLAEGSVTRAARRLGLSASAMSRTLSRLRVATGDPLLVRAGRSLVATPRAAELRHHVHALATEARTVLRPASAMLDLRSLEVTFTLRAGEWFLEMLASAVVAAVTRVAPRVRLRFVPKNESDARQLREGSIDLEIGKQGTVAPEIRTRTLFRDRYVGVARTGHPLLAGGKVTARRYAACSHVVASPLGDASGPVDAALRKLALERSILVVVPGYPDAMRVASRSDLIAQVPRANLGNELARGHAATLGLQSFELPVRLPPITVSAMWHPRKDADPAQRWLRKVVIATCRAAYP